MAVVLPVVNSVDAGDSPLARAVLAGYNRSKDMQERNRLQEILFQRQDEQEQRNFERQQLNQDKQFTQQQNIQDRLFGQQQQMANLNFQNQSQLQDQKLNYANQSQQNKALMIGEALQSTEGLPLNQRFQALVSSGVPVSDAAKVMEQFGDTQGGGKEFQKTLAKEEAKDAIQFRKSVNDAALTAKKQLKHVDKLEEILDKGLQTGKLRDGLEFFNSLTSSFNIPPIGDSSSAAEYKKTSADLIIQMAKQFGSRITDADLAYVEKNAPSLGRSVEANKGMIKILRRIAQDGINRQKAMNEVIKNNGITGNISMLTDEYLDNFEGKKEEGNNVVESSIVSDQNGNRQVAIEILREAGGDRDKARAIAQQRGIKF